MQKLMELLTKINTEHLKGSCTIEQQDDVVVLKYKDIMAVGLKYDGRIKTAKINKNTIRVATCNTEGLVDLIKASFHEQHKKLTQRNKEVLNIPTQKILYINTRAPRVKVYESLMALVYGNKPARPVTPELIELNIQILKPYLRDIKGFKIEERNFHDIPTAKRPANFHPKFATYIYKK